MSELVELTVVQKNYDSILVNLSSTRWILVSILIVLFIFFVMTIAFVYYPVSIISNQVTEIHTESKQALVILQNGSTQVESTLTKLNTAAVEALKLEDTIIGFVRSACSIPPFKFTSYCIELNNH